MLGIAQGKQTLKAPTSLFSIFSSLRVLFEGRPPSLGVESSLPKIGAHGLTELVILKQSPYDSRDNHWEPAGLRQGPDPNKVQKESEGVSRGFQPRGGPRVPQECAPESHKRVQKRVRSCVFGLFCGTPGALLRTLGLPGAGSAGTLFQTLFGLFWGSGQGRPLCQAGGIPRQWGGFRYYGSG